MTMNIRQTKVIGNYRITTYQDGGSYRLAVTTPPGQHEAERSSLVMELWESTAIEIDRTMEVECRGYRALYEASELERHLWEHDSRYDFDDLFGGD